MENPLFPSPINHHFFQPLLPGFHNHLNIPARFFMKHIEGQNENKTAKLRSDVSHKTWEVKMVGRRFTDGWKDFADDNDFRVGDLIVFRHEGDIVFHVTGFGPSCCNLQYDVITNISGEEIVEKNSRTEAESSSSHSCFVAHVTVSNLRVDTLMLPRSFARSNGLKNRCCDIVLMNEHGKSWTLHLRYKKSSDAAYIIQGWRSFCDTNGQKAGAFFTLKLVRNGTTPVLQLSATGCGNNCTPEKNSRAKEMNINSKKHSSKDRSSSGECSKRKAKRTYSRWRVSSSPRQNRLVTITLSPKILREGWLRLPLCFTRANGINKSGRVTLVDKYGVEWPTNLWMEKKTGIMGLGKGLRGFFGAMSAKEGESFMLELSWRDTTPILKFCSKIYRDTKSAECETIAKDTDQMAKSKQTIRENLTTPEVFVKEEESLGPSWCEFGAFECGSNRTPEKHLRAKEMKISSRKRSGRDERISGEFLKRNEKKTRSTWKMSHSPRQNRFVTLALTPYNIKKSKLVNSTTLFQRFPLLPLYWLRSVTQRVYALGLVQCLPTKFTGVNGIQKPREIILMDKDGVRRPNKLVCSSSRHGRMGLGRGWKGFCEANDVKAGESFVLKLIWEDTTPVLKFCSKIKTE